MSQAVRIEAPFCSKCSQPFTSGPIDAPITCAGCQSRRRHFRCAVARYKFNGAVRELVHRFKYKGDYHLRHQLGAWLLDGLSDERLCKAAANLVVPVPLHPVRQREREYNQSEELARLLCKATGLPMAQSLRRIRPTPTQTQLDRNQRMENLRNAFEIRKNAQVRGLHILLIDDVFTTGSTVAECARTLKRAGAASVTALTVARG